VGQTGRDNGMQSSMPETSRQGASCCSGVWSYKLLSLPCSSKEKRSLCTSLTDCETKSGQTASCRQRREL